MSTAREIMHFGVECVDADSTLAQAARQMRDLRVGALPICGPDNRLAGIITDRDIVIRCVANGYDPQTMTAAELAKGTPIWVDADSDVDEVLRLMQDNKIRRLPVMDERQLIGMISEADLAAHITDHELSSFVESVYTAPATN